MNVRNLFLIVGVLTLVTLVAPALAFAQTADHIATLQISVWPEFDDPRVLVQYDGTLAAKDGYPREVSFFIPAAASLNATAYADENKTLFNTDPATVTDAANGLKRVTFQVPKPDFHLEYYHDTIQGAPDKSFEFDYVALMPADQVSIQIQQPLKAEQFTTSPAAALVSEGMHDFKYHIFNYSDVTADQTLKLQVNYVKTDPNPSLENVVVPATTAQAAADNALSTDPQQLIVIVGAGIVLALGLLALWMWRSRRQPQLAFGHVSGGGRTHATERGTGGFCGQCGNALHPGDRFCPKCGAKRK